MTLTSTAGLIELEQFGNLPAGYQHEWRVARPLAPICVGGGVFKWYHVVREDGRVSDDLDAAARAVLVDNAPGWDLSYGLNFAMLHVSTTGAYLLAGVWRGHNELWMRAFACDPSGGPFERVSSAEDAPAGCVWEMGVHCHERLAWHRYLFSDRRDADKRAWLDDTYLGRV